MTGGVAIEGGDGAELNRLIESIVRRSGTSFYWGMRVLPPERRQAMYAIYAFCREVDDIADGSLPAAAKAARLDAWAEEIERLFAGRGGAETKNPAAITAPDPLMLAAFAAGRPSEPIARALATPVAAFALAKRDFLAVIEGMRTDATARVRFPDRAALAHYCDCVAGAVGRLSNPVFGIARALGDPLAGALGEALQLTNILRDLDEDAALDRLYLPADLLARHGIPADSPAAVLAHPALSAACAEIAARAGARFDEARAILARIGPRERKPAVLMMEAYWRIYRRLVARGFAPPRRPVALSRLEKAWIALKNGIA
ncbi:MAG: squalene synthase HpnD [Rhodospirillales bacterium]|nr:squalene synthase HpnD [Rhodospirillales bacterium]